MRNAPVLTFTTFWPYSAGNKLIFSQYIGFDISCKLSPKETTCMKYQSLFNTVDSRYLEFQGTLWNTSRYPYLDISNFQNLGKKLFEQPHLTNLYVIGLLTLEIYRKYCGKEEKLLLRSNFSSFPQYFLLVVRFSCSCRDKIFTSRSAVIWDKRVRDNECQLYLSLFHW